MLQMQLEMYMSSRDFMRYGSIVYVTTYEGVHQFVDLDQSCKVACSRNVTLSYRIYFNKVESSLLKYALKMIQVVFILNPFITPVDDLWVKCI